VEEGSCGVAVVVKMWVIIPGKSRTIPPPLPVSIRGVDDQVARHAPPVSRDTPKSGPKIKVFILTSIAVTIKFLQFYRGQSYGLGIK
jgi:hypothetical protein